MEILSPASNMKHIQVAIDEKANAVYGGLKKWNARNKAIKSRVKTSIKKVDAAVEAKDQAVAVEALKAAIKEINMAGSKGVYHKNTCARKVSRLTKAVNEIA